MLVWPGIALCLGSSICFDTDGDGKFDTLEVETRNFKGPRVYDDSGLTLHPDDMSVIKERIYLDKADRNLLHDDITVTDSKLTRPWTVMKTYKRETTPARRLGRGRVRGGQHLHQDRQGISTTATPTAT